MLLLVPLLTVAAGAAAAGLGAVRIDARVSGIAPAAGAALVPVAAGLALLSAGFAAAPPAYRLAVVGEAIFAFGGSFLVGAARIVAAAERSR